MKKSIKTNGHLITRRNFVAWCKKNDIYDDCTQKMLRYLVYLDGAEDWPIRLDSWAADYSAHTYQVGGEWYTIYREDVDVVAEWLDAE